MGLSLYNTMTKQVEEFVPIDDRKVKMYVCGVTVYNDIHMGHARSIIVFDMIARYLKSKGYKVTLVRDAHSSYSAKAAELIDEWNEKLRLENVDLESASGITFG